MTFVLSLLTFFLDAKPNVPPPSPASRGAMIVPSDSDAPASAETPYQEIGTENLGLTRLTPPAWQASPSLMVARPPVPANTFDMFSPRMRPPQELPGLFPCEPVALVPCPSPEPPAVRHVSFMDNAIPQLASNDSSWLFSKPGSECTPECFHSPDLAESACDKRHSKYANPAHPFPVYPHPPIHPPHPAHFGHMPVAFGGPFVGGPMCPADGPCPALAETALFPGAKKVQHVVRATYDVPHETAKALKPILEQSQGVMECVVEGDELTINAVGPAQTAIARFLATVVNQPRIISQPVKAVEVNFTESTCCNDKCKCKDKCQCCGSEKPAKAMNVKFTEPKCSSDCKKESLSDCKEECKEECKGCCKNRTQAANCSTDCSNACSKTSACPLTIDCPVKGLTGKVFSFSVGFDRAGTCSKVTQCTATSTCKEGVSCKAEASCTKPCETQAVVQWKSSTQSKPVKVFIAASSEGVMVKTSDGTQLRAQQIQLETDGVHKLEVRNADAVFTMPKLQKMEAVRGAGQALRTSPNPFPHD